LELISGGEMRVDPARKALYLVAVTALLIVFCGYTPAGAFNNEPVDHTLFLAQAETSSDEVPDQTEQEKDDEYDDDEYDDDEYEDDDVELISDPLEQGNRDFYAFNDTMYFWVLKPVSRGYGFIIPEELRIAVRNVFYNIRFPVRFINCLLQGKGKKAQYEFGRFFINTTAGFLGMANVAAAETINLQPSKEDLGQTFAVWGIGNGAYLMVPFFGPYSLRHGIGALGDLFVDPIFWLIEDLWVSLAIRAGETVNDTSLRIGEYEALKEAAIDPYIMIRNAYVQNRNKLIAE
jgi:phospholipid-binding lipoprotein MlaA